MVKRNFDEIEYLERKTVFTSYLLIEISLRKKNRLSMLQSSAEMFIILGLFRENALFKSYRRLKN